MRPVRAISGLPSRQTAKRSCPVWPLHYRTWHVYGPPTYCGTGHFWPTWYFQMRRPGYKCSVVLYCNVNQLHGTRSVSCFPCLRTTASARLEDGCINQLQNLVKGSSIKDVRKKDPFSYPPPPVRRCPHLTNPLPHLRTSAFS